MAIPPTQIWEVRSDTGSATNGGGFNPAVGTIDYTYPTSQTFAYSNLSLSSIPAPSSPFVSVQGSGGTMAAGTHQLATSYTCAGGETLPSIPNAGTTVLNGTITITSPTLSLGATGYNVYMSVSGGSSLFLQNSSPIAISTNYVQTTEPITSGAAMPATTTAYVRMASATRSFAAADAGNTINITAGIGFTAGRYSLTAVSGGVAATDRVIGTTAATSGSGMLGGALAAASTALASATLGNTIWVRKTGTYNVGTGLVFALQNFLIGYGTVRGDGLRPTLQIASGSSSATCIDASVSGTPSDGTKASYVMNFVLDANSTTLSACIKLGMGFYQNLKAINYTDFGFLGLSTNGTNVSEYFGLDTLVWNCEAVGPGKAVNSGQWGSYGFKINDGGFARFHHCYAHDNYLQGFFTVWGSSFFHCTSANNGQDGFASRDFSWFSNCIAYNNGTSGFNHSYGTGTAGPLFHNNISALNGGWGILGNATAGSSSSSNLAFTTQGFMDTNAFYANASGAMNFTPPYVNTNIILTADPFVSGSTGDLRLNNTAGGGAAIRGIAVPNALPGSATAKSFGDLGPLTNGNLIVFS